MQVSIICSDPEQQVVSHLLASTQPEKWSFFKSLTKSFRVFSFLVLKVQSMMTGLFAFLCVLLFALANAQVDTNDTLSADSGEEMEYEYDEGEILALLTKIDSV